MADNVELDAGSGGATVAADDIAGVHYQRVKINYGVDGSATDVSDTNPLPIDDAGGSLTVDGTVTANLSATDNAVLDDIAASLAGTLTVDASGAAVPVTDNGGSLTVDGTVAATQSGTWNVTNVSGTVSLPTGAATAAKQPALGTAGSASSDVITVQGVASMTPLQVADNGGSLTVDGTVAVSGTVAVTDNSGSLTVDDGGSSLTVDGSVTAVGAAAENAAVSGNPVLTGGRYDSTPRTLGNGDVGALALNASGQVLVEIAAGAGSGGTAAADDADFTAGTTSGTPVMGVYESSPTSVTDGDLGTVGITSTRALKVAIASGGVAGIAEDSASAGGEEGIMMLAVRRDSASSGVSADGDFAALSVTSDGSLRVSGSAGTTQYTEDGASAGGESLCLAGTVRRDTAASSAGTDGDYATLNTDANGRLHVLDGNSGAALTALQIIDDWDESDRAKVNIVAGQAGITAGAGAVGASTPRVTLASDDPAVALLTTIDADTGNLGASLTALQLIDNPIVAHDAAASGSSGVNMAGGYATNSIEGLTQVAAADASRIVTDLNGVQVTRPHTTLEELISERVSNTDGSSTAFTNFAAGGSGVHNYVTQVSIWNSSSTDGYVDFRDGTGGTVKWTFPAPQTGGCTVSFDPPLKFADNTAVAYDVSGAISTVYISVNGFQAQG